MTSTQTTVTLNLDVILNLTPEREADLIRRANDREALGVDDLSEPITTLSEAVRELIMFDPLYLFSSPSPVIGWIAEVTPA